MSHQHTSKQIIPPNESFIIPNGSFTQDFLVSRNTKASCAHILQELNMQARATYQSSKSAYRIYAHILWELNMQAQTQHNTELVHIS